MVSHRSGSSVHLIPRPCLDPKTQPHRVGRSLGKHILHRYATHCLSHWITLSVPLDLVYVAADLDACVWFPCTNGTGRARCRDVSVAAGGRNNTDGRTCACLAIDNSPSLTQHYANDTAGCTGQRRLTEIGTVRPCIVCNLFCPKSFHMQGQALQSYRPLRASQG